MQRMEKFLRDPRKWLIGKSVHGRWHIIPPQLDENYRTFRRPLLGAWYNTGAEALAAFNRGHR